MPTQLLSKTHKNKCWWMNLSSMLTGDLLGARNTQFNTNFIHKEPHQNILFFHLNIFGRFCLFLSWLFNPFNSFLDIISTLMKILFSHRKISYRHRQRFLQNKLHERMKDELFPFTQIFSDIGWLIPYAFYIFMQIKYLLKYLFHYSKKEN